MHAFTVILALAASAMAYSVTEPSETEGFTSHGPNTVSWTKVDTDAADFQIILTNQVCLLPCHLGRTILISFPPELHYPSREQATRFFR